MDLFPVAMDLNRNYQSAAFTQHVEFKVYCLGSEPRVCGSEFKGDEWRFRLKILSFWDR